MKTMDLPILIQGGMGVAVSHWKLARAVSLAGQLGVVAGTALDAVMARRLQMGDPGGVLRRAFEAFPAPGVARAIWDRFFIEGGKAAGEPFRAVPMSVAEAPSERQYLTVVANFCEVFLAREGHAGWVGINLLEKIQLPTLPALYGAMMAGVAVVLMGAGIPKQIPGILDAFARGEPAELKLDVAGALAEEAFWSRFDPRGLWDGPPPALPRPQFLAVVSSSALATNLARKASGRVDGFVVEGATAGGHNAPPRGPLQLTAGGEPIYGPRDVPDLAAFRALGLPFWLAGGYGRPGGLARAQAEGARGIQAGTIFALCEESGLDPAVRAALWEHLRAGSARVKTDPRLSPTGFPFKAVLGLNGGTGEREKVCDLGFLRTNYRREDGSIGFRCPAEPEAAFLRKGGTMEETAGRQCVCNGLLATIGLGQTRADGSVEEPLITAGDALLEVVQDFPDAAASGELRAEEVVRALT